MDKLPRTFACYVAVILATVVGLSANVAIPQPALAVTYRDVKSVKYNRCFYAVGDPLEDLYLMSCSTTPAKNGNWAVANVGSYYGHPLWTLTRQGGSCLGVLGSAASNYLYMSCATANSRNVWEVFTTSDGRHVLKSFGAFKSWGQHRCLTFPQSGGMGSVRLGGCSLTNAANKVYK